MKLVILESPLRGYDYLANLEYARQALHDSLRHGEAPIASHLLYTQVLDDKKEWQRAIGMAAGHAWYRVAEACIVYADLGVSEGMRAGIDQAIDCGIPVEYRYIHDNQNQNANSSREDEPPGGRDEGGIETS